MVTVDYKVLCDTPVDLSMKVRKHLANGWVLYGEPIAYRDYIAQIVIQTRSQ